MPLYKIGLLSTHGTGKTALVYSIAGELKRRGIKVRPISEIATRARESGIPINRETTLAAQAWILHCQCQMELEAEMLGYEVVICDRTVLDNYVYLETAEGRSPEYLQLIRNHLQLHGYRKLYLLPIIFPPVADGIRDSSVKFQEEIDERLRNFLQEMKIDYQELALPEHNDLFRIDWVQTIVQQTLKDLGRKTLMEFSEK